MNFGHLSIASFGTLTSVAVVVGIILLVLIFLKPLGKIVKFLLHAALGFVLLFFVNMIGQSVGVHLEPNLLHCLITGFLGIPGVVVLLIYYYVL